MFHSTRRFINVKTRQKNKNGIKIGLCFGSASSPLIYSVAIIFQKFGIEPHISKDKRKIYLYSEKAVVDYLKIFGSSNPRITNKFNEWKGA